MINLKTRYDPAGTKVLLTVDPVAWAEKRIQDYITDLENEVSRLRVENSRLAFTLAAVYEPDQKEAADKLERIRELLDS